MASKRKKSYLSYLIYFSQNEEWKKQRSAANPIIAKPKTVASYLDIHNTIMDEFMDILRNKTKVDEKTGAKSINVEKFENNLKFLALESNKL